MDRKWTSKRLYWDLCTRRLTQIKEGIIEIFNGEIGHEYAFKK